MEETNNILLKEIILLSRDIDFSSLKPGSTDFKVKRLDDGKIDRVNIDFYFRFIKRKNFSCDYEEENSRDGHIYLYYYRYLDGSGYVSYSKVLYHEEDEIAGAKIEIETYHASAKILDCFDSLLTKEIEKKWTPKNF